MSSTDTTADARRARNALGAAALQGHRYRLGLTVRQLAKAVGAEERTVYAWEQGHARPRPATYARLHAVLGLGRDEYLWRDEAEVTQ